MGGVGGGVVVRVVSVSVTVGGRQVFLGLLALIKSIINTIIINSSSPQIA